MTDLRFIHRAKNEENAYFLLRQLTNEFGLLLGGTFELRGLNLMGQDEEHSQDFLAGYCYAEEKRMDKEDQ